MGVNNNDGFGDLPGWLSALRVVECGEGVSAAFAAKLLADLGAEVIKVESPAGDCTRRRGPFPGSAADPEKSGLYIYLNAGKRGVTLDLARHSDREKLDRLLSKADILIHNVPPPGRAAHRLDSARLCADHPQLVVSALSPFGDSGPRRDWRAYELNIQHAGGWAYLGPRGSQSPTLPPLKLFGSQAEFVVGIHASFAALAAYWHRLAGGGGQAVEVSAQECIAAMLEIGLVHYTYGGRENSRLGQVAIVPGKIMECADGFILILAIEDDQWSRLVEFMGNPWWAGEEVFKDRFARSRNADALYALMDDWVRQWKAQELYHAAQARRLPFASVNTMRDLYANAHLRERGFFVPFEQPGVGTLIMPGAPFKAAACGWSLRSPAPGLGEHNAELTEHEAPAPSEIRPTPGHEASQARPTGSALPLAGLRILDLTWVWAGPYCTLQFAHMGAEVIRVESSRRLCPTRFVPPHADDIPGPNRCGYFNQYSQGKRSITLNLSTQNGIAIALELVRHCDVVVENFAAGVLSRLGLGYERLREYRPDLIMLSISGYGQTGPCRNYVSYGPPAEALAGVAAATGYEGGSPCDPGIAYADPNAGILGATAIMAALLHRRATGEGQYIDLSQFEGAVELMPEALLEFAMNGREPERIGNHDPWMAPHNCYKASGDADKWVSIAIGSEQEWRALCATMGRRELADDPRFRTMTLRKRNEAALDRIITGWTCERDRWEVTEALQQAGVAAFPSMSNKDIATDRHLLERGYLVTLEHAEVGSRIHAGIPWTMSGTPCRVRTPAPLLGADTRSVLSQLLGYSDTQIQVLQQEGVLS